jgi:hypothetical protein
MKDICLASNKDELHRLGLCRSGPIETLIYMSHWKSEIFLEPLILPVWAQKGRVLSPIATQKSLNKQKSIGHLHA